MPAQERVCHGAHPEHTSSSDAGDLRCCVHQCSKPYSEFFTFVTDIFWGFTQENIATHHRPIPLTHQGTSGCAARCRLLRPGIASPRAPCAWSFQGQPVLTPVFSRACFPQTGGGLNRFQAIYHTGSTAGGKHNVGDRAQRAPGGSAHAGT